MKPQDVIDAMTALQDEGIDVTNAKIRERIGRGSLRDVQRIRREIAAQTVTAAAVAGPHQAEPVATVPATLQAITAAQAALEAAQQHLATLKEQHAPVLRQWSLLRAAVPNSQDPAWFDYNQSWGLIDAATKAVERAEQDLTYARQAHDRHVYELAAAEVAQTPEGQALLAKIDDYQRQYEEADAKGSPATYSWQRIKFQAQQQYRDLVNIHRGLLQPKAPLTEEQLQQGRVGVVAEMERGNPARNRHLY